MSRARGSHEEEDASDDAFYEELVQQQAFYEAGHVPKWSAAEGQRARSRAHVRSLEEWRETYAPPWGTGTEEGVHTAERQQKKSSALEEDLRRDFPELEDRSAMVVVL